MAPSTKKDKAATKAAVETEKANPAGILGALRAPSKDDPAKVAAAEALFAPTQGLIYGKIADILKKIEPIAKAQENKNQGYSFRGIDDVYNELNRHLAEARVFFTSQILNTAREDRATAKNTAITSILTIRWKIFATDGSFITTETVGEGVDYGGDKASSKAMSAAYKYAFLQLFCIPTQEEKVTNEQSNHIEAMQPIKITIAQKQKITEYYKELKITTEQWAATLEKYKVTSVDKLTSTQATQLIQLLESKKTGKPPATNGTKTKAWDK